jgi:hypothetical protein
MTQDMHTESHPIPSKEDIVETVMDIFVRETGFVERDAVSKETDLVRDLEIHHEDISIFVTMAFKHFGVPIFAEGDFPPTIGGVSDFIFDYLSSGRQDEDPRDKQGLWGTFLKWISL